MMKNMAFSKLLPNLKTWLADDTALQDVLSIRDTGSLGHYPGLTLVGMVGFDPAKQQFVWLQPKQSDQSVSLDSDLTEREHEILRLVAAGYANAQIGRELVISENTVKVHMRHIFEKLDVQSRTEAAMYGLRCGWFAVA